MENQIAASGYILTFFNDVESLTNYHATYSNLVIEYKALFPTNYSLKKLDDAHREILLNTIRSLRFWIKRTYIKFSALKYKIKGFNDSETKLTALYDKIKDAPAPELDDVENYVLELNKLFVLGIVAELLTKAAEIYGKLAAQNET